MAQETFDVVVAGIGGMGSAALYHLAKRGIKVCGVEQFTAGHQHGSSHGETRIIRKAYPEEPKYIPLLNRAYELWSELEEETGVELFVKCGFIALAAVGSDFLNTIGEGNRHFGLPHQYWEAGEIRKQYPQYQIPENMAAYFDPLGGFLYVESAVLRHAQQAVKFGATIYTNEKMLDWRTSGEGIIVQTSRRAISTKKLILAAGAWAAPEMKKLGISLRLWRRVLLWFRTQNLKTFQPHQFPSFVIDLGETLFYGCPAINDFGVKIGEHNIPFHIDDPAQMALPVTDPEIITIVDFVKRFFPALNPQPSKQTVCMYTVTPDRHFIIDLHPHHPNVVFGCGFSGHGFKFAPVVGEILADLALEGSTAQPIDFLRLSRF